MTDLVAGGYVSAIRASSVFFLLHNISTHILCLYNPKLTTKQLNGKNHLLTHLHPTDRNTTRYPDPMRSRTALFANVKSKVSDYLRTCFAVVGNKLAETRCGAMPRFATPRERTLWLTHMQGVRGMSLPRLLRVLQGENKWSSVVQVGLGHADPIETLF